MENNVKQSKSEIKKTPITKSIFNNKTEIKDDKNYIEEVEELEIEKNIENNQNQDIFDNYIIEILNYTSGSKFIRFNWNGIQYLDGM